MLSNFCSERCDITSGVVLFKGRLRQRAPELLRELAPVLKAAPFRHMLTPMGKMSVAISNCGASGWVSDTKGYRYSPLDPVTGKSWPEMPDILRREAVLAAADAGFADFSPDACLINRYDVGARMGLHQDKDEADFRWPIVSFSFGLTALFVLGGSSRRGKTQTIALEHGDTLVWGDAARLYFHAVKPVKAGYCPDFLPDFFPDLFPDSHPDALPGSPTDSSSDTENFRLNLTFRRAAPG